MYIKHLKGKVCRYFWSRNADHLVKVIQFYLYSTFNTTNFDKGVLLLTPHRATGASYCMLSNLLRIAVLHLLYYLNYQRALSAGSCIFTQNAVKLLAWLPCRFESHDFLKHSFKFPLTLEPHLPLALFGNFFDLTISPLTTCITTAMAKANKVCSFLHCICRLKEAFEATYDANYIPRISTPLLFNKRMERAEWACGRLGNSGKSGDSLQLYPSTVILWHYLAFLVKLFLHIVCIK